MEELFKELLDLNNRVLNENVDKLKQLQTTKEAEVEIEIVDNTNDNIDLERLERLNPNKHISLLKVDKSILPDKIQQLKNEKVLIEQIDKNHQYVAIINTLINQLENRLIQENVEQEEVVTISEKDKELIESLNPNNYISYINSDIEVLPDRIEKLKLQKSLVEQIDDQHQYLSTVNTFIDRLENKYNDHNTKTKEVLIDHEKEKLIEELNPDKYVNYTQFNSLTLPEVTKTITMLSDKINSLKVIDPTHKYITIGNTYLDRLRKRFNQLNKEEIYND